MQKIILIDGNSIINRAFYGIPLLTNDTGEHTNAVYGFLNIFFKLCDEETPDFAAVAFDLKEPTFRHKMYKQYKAHRKPTPAELIPQIALLKNLLRIMNISVVEHEGFEADDCIGTLATLSETAGLNVIIVSGDKDMLQLATDKTCVLIPKTKAGKTITEKYTATDVFEKIGVTPKQYICVKALMGDASDNIPGVPGIGEITAVKIIKRYGTLEDAIRNAGDIKPAKASENLIKNIETARLSRELSEICLNVPISLDLSSKNLDNLYNPAALEELTRLKLKSFIARFHNGVQISFAPF